MCVSAYLYSHNGRLEEMCSLRNFFFVSVGKEGRNRRAIGKCVTKTVVSLPMTIARLSYYC